MTRPEHLAALIDLGYNEQESRFLYLVATHSGYFTLRQFLDYTGTSKGRNVHQFTSKSIRLGHVRAATCGYRTSVFNLFSRKVYGALDRDNLRNRRRLSSELIQTRLLILDFVLAHPGLEYLETEAEKVAYFRELAVPEALIPGRVYKGIDPNSTTKRCFVDRFPVFFSAESDCPPGELTPTFVYCDSASRGLFHYITHLRSYEHFLRRLSGFYFVYAAPSPVKFRRAEQFFRSTFEENSAANVQSIARYFRVRRLWDDEQTQPSDPCRPRPFTLRQPALPRRILGIDLPEMGHRRDGGTGPGGPLGSAPDGTEVEVPHPSLAPRLRHFWERIRYESQNGNLRGSFCIPFRIPF